MDETSLDKKTKPTQDNITDKTVYLTIYLFNIKYKIVKFIYIFTIMFTHFDMLVKPWK